MWANPELENVVWGAKWPRKTRKECKGTENNPATSPIGNGPAGKKLHGEYTCNTPKWNEMKNYSHTSDPKKKTSTRVEGLFLESSFTQFCFCFLVRLNELNKKVKLPAWGGKWACPCLRVCRTKRSEMANVGCSSHTLLQVTRRTTESTIHWNEEKPFVNKKSNQIINSKVKMMNYKKTCGNGRREG